MHVWSCLGFNRPFSLTILSCSVSVHIAIIVISVTVILILLMQELWSYWFHNRECPTDLKEVIATILYAAPRCGDLPELQEIRTFLRSTYGDEFCNKAVNIENQPSLVNRKVIYLSIYLSVCLYLCICLSVCLTILASRSFTKES